MDPLTHGVIKETSKSLWVFFYYSYIKS
jgi:hypothetical protein